MILSIHDLTIGYGKHSVMSNLNLSASAGKLISLIGRNGYGKTTLLRTIAGLQPALSGRIEIDGLDVTKISDRRRSLVLSLVLTDRIEVDNLSVFDLVALGRYPYTSWNGKLGTEDTAIVDEALRQVGIEHLRDKMLSQTSDGEKQRAVIAKALAQATPLVLLDEPTSHLDLANRIGIVLLLRDLAHRTGKTFVLSTHELDLAIKMSDQVWLMQRDRIVEGVPEDLLLKGVFQESFQSDAFNFDTEDGHYQIVNIPNGDGSVQIVGDTSGESAKWLRRALTRCGIREADDAERVVEISESQFIYNEKKTESIGELLGLLGLN